MAKRLTTFSKLLITLLILALIFFGFTWLKNNTGLGDLVNDGGTTRTEQTSGNTKTSGDKTTIMGKNSNGSKNSNAARNNSGASDDDNTLKVQLVSWGGYAPGLYFNEGAEANLKSRFYKDYGFKVDFKLG